MIMTVVFMFIVPLDVFSWYMTFPNMRFLPAIILIYFFSYFWDRPRIYFSNKCFAISFDGVKISLVLSGPQSPGLFHRCVMKFVQQLFHMKGMKKYRGAPANACFISKLFWGRFWEMRMKIMEREKGTKPQQKNCSSIFIAVCTLSTELCLPLVILLFLWLIRK